MKNYVASADTVKDSACKTATRKSQWLDLSAMGLALFFIVFGELIWLPDPLRVGHHVYWIELFDELIYIGLLPLILWSTAAVRNINRELKCWKTTKKLAAASITLVFMRAVGLISSFIVMYCILFAQQQYLWMVVCLACAWITSLISIHLSEWSHKHRVPFRSLTFLGFTIVLLYFLLWPTNYVVTYPGLTMNMNEYAQVDKGNSSDQIAGVLIFERPAFRIDRLYAKFFTVYEFAKKAVNQPSLHEQLQEVRTQQIDANQVASAVAFAKVGLGQGAISHGAMVNSVVKDFPAAKQLKAGDVIIQANGDSISTTIDLINHIKQIKPGNELKLVIKRNGAELKVAIQTQADAKEPKNSVIGVQVSDEVELDLPLKVKFKPYLLHVGGPSHGAMLTLALIDQLTTGGITNGNIVAGTGTINSLGQVGQIGGIRQKAYTVERSAADVFFVPYDQYEEARRGAKLLNIVPVKTIDDILKWLKEHPKP
ncbi:PDZ domain-containing protein [Paenibacillus psychroresistens]|uniref:PDZ domain-containing protein n=1 Tax=Paenibacillus psychroresistens TaxID=1778678 RepID=UPI0013913D17|nr:PDZ domain-containing protein [Paenibacillus psychroresistens]